MGDFSQTFLASTALTPVSVVGQSYATLVPPPAPALPISYYSPTPETVATGASQTAIIQATNAATQEASMRQQEAALRAAEADKALLEAQTAQMAANQQTIWGNQNLLVSAQVGGMTSPGIANNAPSPITEEQAATITGPTVLAPQSGPDLTSEAFRFGPVNVAPKATPVDIPAPQTMAVRGQEPAPTTSYSYGLGGSGAAGQANWNDIPTVKVTPTPSHEVAFVASPASNTDFMPAPPVATERLETKGWEASKPAPTTVVLMPESTYKTYEAETTGGRWDTWQSPSESGANRNPLQGTRVVDMQGDPSPKPDESPQWEADSGQYWTDAGGWDEPILDLENPLLREVTSNRGEMFDTISGTTTDVVMGKETGAPSASDWDYKVTARVAAQTGIDAIRVFVGQTGPSTFVGNAFENMVRRGDSVINVMRDGINQTPYGPAHIPAARNAMIIGEGMMEAVPSREVQGVFNTDINWNRESNQSYDSRVSSGNVDHNAMFDATQVWGMQEGHAQTASVDWGRANTTDWWAPTAQEGDTFPLEGWRDSPQATELTFLADTWDTNTYEKDANQLETWPDTNEVQGSSVADFRTPWAQNPWEIWRPNYQGNDTVSYGSEATYAAMSPDMNRQGGWWFDRMQRAA